MERKKFTPAEDKAILHFTETKGREYMQTGNELWRLAERLQLTCHSWQSMRSRYILLCSQPADMNQKTPLSPRRLPFTPLSTRRTTTTSTTTSTSTRPTATSTSTSTATSTSTRPTATWTSTTQATGTQTEHGRRRFTDAQTQTNTDTTNMRNMMEDASTQMTTPRLTHRRSHSI